MAKWKLEGQQGKDGWRQESSWENATKPERKWWGEGPQPGKIVRKSVYYWQMEAPKSSPGSHGDENWTPTPIFQLWGLLSGTAYILFFLEIFCSLTIHFYYLESEWLLLQCEKYIVASTCLILWITTSIILILKLWNHKFKKKRKQLCLGIM